MNIIATDCVGGFTYKKLGIQYNNPFMYTFMSFKDIVYLANNLPTVNFSNLCGMGLSSCWPNTIFINIDNKVKLHFRHDIFTKTVNIPIHKEQSDYIGSTKEMMQHILQTYIRRVQRMISSNEPPTFVIHEFPTKLSINNSIYCDLSELHSSYRVIYLTSKDGNECNNNNVEVYRFDTMSRPSINCNEVLLLEQLFKGDCNV